MLITAVLHGRYNMMSTFIRRIWPFADINAVATTTISLYIVLPRIVRSFLPRQIGLKQVARERSLRAYQSLSLMCKQMKMLCLLRFNNITYDILCALILPIIYAYITLRVYP